jgi:hypothetical protein
MTEANFRTIFINDGAVHVMVRLNLSAPHNTRVAISAWTLSENIGVESGFTVSLSVAAKIGAALLAAAKAEDWVDPSEAEKGKVSDG